MADGVIRLHGADNVVIALQDLPPGSQPAEVALPLPGAVPRGHKIATRAIARGEEVIRYGQIQLLKILIVSCKWGKLLPC